MDGDFVEFICNIMESHDVEELSSFVEAQSEKVANRYGWGDHYLNQEWNMGIGAMSYRSAANNIFKV